MKYMGSKRRIAKEILPIILEGRKPDQYYVEPFCGGCNTLEHVTGNRIGSDTNQDLISLWQSVSYGWMPPQDRITEFYYNDIKKFPDSYNSALRGYVAFALSYGGKYWGGYRRDRSGKRDYSLEAYKNAVIQFPKLRNVLFYHSSYDRLRIPDRSIIYCDPPYFGTTRYTTQTFDHEKFWIWCKAKKNEGHTVFVSEYVCPVSGLSEVVFEKTQTNTLIQDTGAKKGVEKLFKIL